MNAKVRITGVQGHVAYPQQANNPIPAMAELVTTLSDWKLDEGTPHFAPSTLAFTSVDVGNLAANVIAAEVQGRFNIRFNDLHKSEHLVTHIQTVASAIEDARGVQVTVETNTSGEPFLTRPGPFIKLLCDVVKTTTGQAPDLSTTGGTSDARFIKDMCPVVELGLPGGTMHKTNECVAVEEIARLTDLYAHLLDAYFANPPA
jgi:succinyl-diaminopimelate desuccinylase